MTLNIQHSNTSPVLTLTLLQPRPVNANLINIQTHVTCANTKKGTGSSQSQYGSCSILIKKGRRENLASTEARKDADRKVPNRNFIRALNGLSVGEGDSVGSGSLGGSKGAALPLVARCCFGGIGLGEGRRRSNPGWMRTQKDGEMNRMKGRRRNVWISESGNACVIQERGRALGGGRESGGCRFLSERPKRYESARVGVSESRTTAVLARCICAYMHNQCCNITYVPAVHLRHCIREGIGCPQYHP